MWSKYPSFSLENGQTFWVGMYHPGLLYNNLCGEKVGEKVSVAHWPPFVAYHVPVLYNPK
jgi:hypothetical protein